MSGLMSVTGEPDGPAAEGRRGAAGPAGRAGGGGRSAGRAAGKGARSRGRRARRGGEPDGGERGGADQRAGQSPGDRRGAAAVGECPPEHRAVPVVRDAGWVPGHRGRQRRAVRAAARGAGAGRRRALRDERRARGSARGAGPLAQRRHRRTAAATSWWRRCAPRTCRPVRWPAWGRRCETWKRPTAAIGSRRRRPCALPPTRSGSTGRALRSAARRRSLASTPTSC